jgi:hypothetical protein
MWGSEHDVTMARRTDILEKLPVGKKLLVDKGYIGLPLDQILLPFRGDWHHLTPEQQTHNSAISSVRVQVEHSIRRIKMFDCLTNVWRHSVDLHPAAFHVCGNLANIYMNDFPTTRTVNTWLM